MTPLYHQTLIKLRSVYFHMYEEILEEIMEIQLILQEMGRGVNKITNNSGISQGEQCQKLYLPLHCTLL